MSRNFPVPIQLGISTCPNDTFAFHALITRAIDWRGLDFHVELLDIQELNERLFAGHLDIAKASFHAALLLAQECWVMPSGSALGFGVGPLLLAARAGTAPEPGEHQLTLCPGDLTTASLLFRLFYPQQTRVEQTRFSNIMPRLSAGDADFGVCIHEGRFTWPNAGLALVEDLGYRWEQETSCPLPLGGIVARRSLPHHVIQTAQEVIFESIAFAMNNPGAALPTMRSHAQEFEDHVLMQHVDLYVNQWTRELGAEGRRALTELSRRAHDAGIVSAQTELAVFAGR